MTTTYSEVEQHGLGKSLLLHLLPGALITIFLIVFGPVLMRMGWPPIFSLFLAILLVLIPFELGYLLLQGRRLNGRWSLRGVVLFREPVPLWQYFLLVPVLFAWAGFVFVVLAKPLDAFLTTRFFSWVPSWFFLDRFDSTQYSGSVLKLTWLFGLALNGVLGPVVEELYFRGYLLPRLARFGWVAPLLNVVLFSLYHFFSPWQNLTRIVGFLPYVYVVWWKKDVKLGICVHCLCNISSIVLWASPFWA